MDREISDIYPAVYIEIKIEEKKVAFISDATFNMCILSQSIVLVNLSQLRPRESIEIAGPKATAPTPNRVD